MASGLDRRSGIAGAPFRLTLAVTVLGFGGYALLFPVVPLWAARGGGAGALGAGITTAVLMLTTVATQLAVPWLMRRVGHRWVLGVGLVLLGAPAPMFALSAAPGPLIAVSAVRGIGFGLLTVVGAAMVAELVPAAQHGRAMGWYGIGVGAPQLFLLAAGVATVDRWGFLPVFIAAGVAPLLGALLVPLIHLPERPESPADNRPDLGRGSGAALRSGVGPLVAMAACALAQGGLVTFLPLAVVGGGALVPAALLGASAGGLVGRFATGVLVDRFGIGGRIVGPAAVVTGLGSALPAALLGSPVAVVAGAVLVGAGFGAVQNDALTALLATFGPTRYGTASAAWNIAFDGGTGIGAIGLGAIADPFGFRAAFGTAAGLCVLAAMPALRRRSVQRG
jgi:MFS family permease